MRSYLRVLTIAAFLAFGLAVPVVATAADPYEPNNSRQTAWGPLTSGAHIQSYMSDISGDGRDFYKFYVSTSGRVNIALTVPDGLEENGTHVIDYDLRLLSSTGSELSRSIRREGGAAEAISYVCEPGWYYIDIDNYFTNGSTTKPYYLDLNMGAASALPGTDPYEPNNSRQTAWGPLTSGAHIQSYMSDISGDGRDFYKFYVSTSGRVNIALTVPDGLEENGTHVIDYDLRLLSSTGSELSRSIRREGGAAEAISYVCEPGWYYIDIDNYFTNGSTTKPYYLDLNMGAASALPGTDPYEPNNSRQTAWGPLTSGAHIQSYMSDISGDGRDFYKFYVSTSGRVNIALTVPDGLEENGTHVIDYDLRLLSSTGSELSRSIRREGGAAEAISYVCEPGWYYIDIDNYFTNGSTTKPYYLDLNMGAASALPGTDPYEPNNSRQTAWGPLTSGAHIQSYMSDISGDGRDFYKFYVSTSGRVNIALTVPDGLEENGTHVIDYDLRLLSSTGSELSRSIRREGGAAEAISYVCEPGWYYIDIDNYFTNGSTTKPYYLDLEGSTIALPPSTIPPDTLGIVFVNGMGNKAPEAMDPDTGLLESPDNNLSRFFNLTRALGYRVFMISSLPGGGGFDSVIDSTGDLESNGAALGSFLRRVKSEQGITHVVIVSHSMGGLVARQFIEHEYTATDPTYPTVAKLITVGTPHAGFHPYANGVVKMAKSFAKDYNLSMQEAISHMTPKYMEEFNKWSFKNPEVPYVLVASHVHPNEMKIKRSLKTLWNTIWRWSKKDLDSDSLVFEPSARGYAIAGGKTGPSVLSGRVSVTRRVVVGKWHGLPSSSAQAEAWKIKRADTLTFDDGVFTKIIKPELRKQW